ncbi:MAG TPA: DUF4118 domain-containing protein, partial [Geothrix sp.]
MNLGKRAHGTGGDFFLWLGEPRLTIQWLHYGLAVVLPLLTLWLRMRFGVDYTQRPLLILFLLPIILSAFLGGLGPGLVSTFLTAGAVAYYLIPPTHSLRIAALHDAIQWIVLMLNGVLVSVLAGALHRARRKEVNPEESAPLIIGAARRGSLPIRLNQ